MLFVNLYDGIDVGYEAELLPIVRHEIYIMYKLHVER